MNGLKVLGVSAVVAVIVASGFALFGPERVIVKEIRELVREQLGAMPGNELFTEDFTQNGVKTFSYRIPFNQGTTTVCSIAWPTNNGASTTLVYAAVRPDTIGTSTTNPQFGIYKGIGRTSTTTMIAGLAVSATGTPVYATTTLHSSTVPAGGNASEFLIFDVRQGSVPFLPVNSQHGFCAAQFKGL